MASAIFSAQTAPHTLMAKWQILQTIVIGTVVVVFIHYFTYYASFHLFVNISRKYTRMCVLYILKLTTEVLLEEAALRFDRKKNA